jgi:hypothetical protein
MVKIVVGTLRFAHPTATLDPIHSFHRSAGLTAHPRRAIEQGALAGKAPPEQ